MKQRVLFLPAAIRSHIVPSLYLAKLISGNLDIYFNVTNDVLDEIVVRQGYKTFSSSPYRVLAGMEPQFVLDTTGKRGRWRILRSIVRNDIFHHRQNELSMIVDKVEPTVIFLDIFNSSDLLLLYPKYSNIKYVFFNPMLSTYRVGGFPMVDQGYWPSPNRPETGNIPKRKLTKLAHRLGSLMISPVDILTEIARRRQFEELTKQKDFASRYPLVSELTKSLLFDNVPEIVLAPLEFEVSPQVRRVNQHYLGLCVSEDRRDTELDPQFFHEFNRILDLKKSGMKLVYCTFGTFYQGPDRPLLDFLNKLLDAVDALEDIVVVLSVNQYVIQALRDLRDASARVFMFSRVPQLSVLQHADLFLTHGGLGSIKESIFYEVPMLVYPLDLRYDQNGNGFKVEYHGIGMRGSFFHERVTEMEAKIREVLIEPRYKSNIRQMRSSIQNTDNQDSIMQVLEKLLGTNEIESTRN